MRWDVFADPPRKQARVLSIGRGCMIRRVYSVIARSKETLCDQGVGCQGPLADIGCLSVERRDPRAGDCYKCTRRSENKLQKPAMFEPHRLARRLSVRAGRMACKRCAGRAGGLEAAMDRGAECGAPLCQCTSGEKGLRVAVGGRVMAHGGAG